MKQQQHGTQSPVTDQNPLFEAFGQMIIEGANREANLRAQLIEMGRRHVEREAELAEIKAAKAPKP